MNIPILQTKNWQNFQTDLGETTFFEKNQYFQYLAIKKSTPFGNYLYLPYGPVAETQKNFQKSLDSLLKLAQKTSAFFIRIEPQNPIFADFLQNFSKNRSKAEKSAQIIKKIQKSTDLNPKDTWILDLQDDEKTLIKNFSQGTRTRFNQFKNKGISVEISQNPADLNFLIDFQKKLAKVKKINTFSENYLKTELAQNFSTLYLVKLTENDEDDEKNQKSEKIIAASLFFDDDETRYYMQSAADISPEFRKLPATVALLTTAIFDAKAKNLKFFDFWGIAPENAPKNHPWSGFTEFKKSFGGQEKSYCGDYDLILNPKKYSAYSLLRKLHRQIRKLKA